ncbi:MAG: hypothetical protein WC765_10940, partial [Phycisphaerae bacterium]
DLFFCPAVEAAGLFISITIGAFSHLNSKKNYSAHFIRLVGLIQVFKALAKAVSMFFLSEFQ